MFYLTKKRNWGLGIFDQIQKFLYERGEFNMEVGCFDDNLKANFIFELEPCGLHFFGNLRQNSSKVFSSFRGEIPLNPHLFLS